MKYHRLEDIFVWQKAESIMISLNKTFEHIYDINYKNQLQRAALSVIHNIEEGFETTNEYEFKNYIIFASDNVSELRKTLDLGVELNYLSFDEFDNLKRDSEIILRMLTSLVKALK